MKITEQLIIKYYSGKCTQEERVFVENWLASSEDEPSELSEKVLSEMDERTWRRIQQTSKISLQSTDKDYAHLKKRDRFDANSNTGVSRKIPMRRNFSRISVAAFLAIGLFIAVGTVAFWFINPWDKQPKDMAVSWEGQTTKKSKRGERPTVILPDSSIVHLNSESLLKYPEHFSDTQRIVYLEGHAHFNVVRDPDKPFIIYTEHSKTEVLGTSFDVNTSHRPGETEIIVTSGSVAFSEKDQTENLVTLTVNERAVLDASKNIAKSKVDANMLSAWTENYLIFDNYTLAEVIGVLEPWYDIQVSVQNTQLMVHDFKLSMKDPSLEAIMDALSFLGEFEYEINNKSVTIY
ncbi:MAG: FecR domain-containing protein [Bacteroidota bacterium]